jgi:cytochrome c
MTRMRKRHTLITLLAMLLMGASAALSQTSNAGSEDLRGHGGPVRAILLIAQHAITASFDSSLIQWDLATGRALNVFRFHAGGVNALAPLAQGGFISAGEDGKIALWSPASAQPVQVLEGHQAPITGLSLAPDGRFLASSSWDGTIRLWDLKEGSVKIDDRHRGNVNAVLFLPDHRLASAGYDGTLRITHQNGETESHEFGTPLNALALAGQTLAIGAGDGQLRLLDLSSGVLRTLPIAEVPLIAIAANPATGLIGVAGFRGALALVDGREGRVIRRLEGPAFPLWSLAFSQDGTQILTGGADRMVRRWFVATGQPVNLVLAPKEDARLEALKTHPGAEVFKACIACHALSAGDGNRAGPSLHQIFGRRIGTAKGYDFSPALRGMELIWTPETVAKLFEIGPNAYTPGTKMPEQIITRAEDRAALIDFLRQATQ